MQQNWITFEVDPNSVSEVSSRPLAALADLSVGAVVLRRAFAPDGCAALVRRLIERGLMYDAKVETVDEKFVRASVKEGGWGKIADPTHSMFGGDPHSRRRRIDVGTSLGNWGNDPEEFFAHARGTHKLFASLFDGIENPIDVLYANLRRLAGVEDKTVLTAREPDGRMYGPAIFRIHYGGYTYGPHFDSVRLREKRVGYAVHRFQEQFAGVMCIQNSVLEGRSAQGIIHRCRWTPEVDRFMQQERFAEYAAAHEIPSVRVSLEPGDLYFFNTQLIHEVPGVPGEQPRIVLATFIGYSPDDPEVFVWS
jgi:hypothetical protein